jgi:biopolymer transport protein ExbB
MKEITGERMKNAGRILILLLGVFLLWSGAESAVAQDNAVPEGLKTSESAAASVEGAGIGFLDVLKNSGVAGLVLWLALLAVSVTGAWLTIDSFLQIQEKRISPPSLVANVRAAMEQGDLMKALEHCNQEPGPLANILSTGFANVEEGFEVVQETVAVAADLESERLMQRVAYLNLIGNIAPMLGLLGTVVGMISAFSNIALGAGAASAGLLALDISMALYTTASGLSIAVPAVGFYYFFRNRATNIILGMEGLTLDLIKVLRNVEIIEEGEA